jgi:hypothetical protein
MVKPLLPTVTGRQDTNPSKKMQEMLMPYKLFFARCHKGLYFYHKNLEYKILEPSYPIDIGDNMEISAMLVEDPNGKLVKVIPVQTKCKMINAEGYSLQIPFASIPFVYEKQS